VSITSFKTPHVSHKQTAKEWVVVDAEALVLGRLASEVAKIIRGKNKPTYSPHVDNGDYVIVINAEKVRLTGKKMTDREYVSHTGYPGGQRFKTPADLMRSNPARIIEVIAKHKVTHTFLVPTVVQAVLEVPHVKEADLSSMQLLMYGAAPMGDVLLRRAIDVLGCQFMQAYGMTETAGTVVVLPPEDHEPQGSRADLLSSVGRVLPWVDMRVVDPQTKSDMPTGQVGEIWLRSEMVMQGYWNKPQDTAETLLEGGWLRTGDAAYLDADGYIYLFDRFKDLIISGGENIYPAEIENILNGHPAILEAAVIGMPHPRWGESPRAVVVLRQDMQATEQALISYARAHLAHYKCPTSVVFTTQLPRNASGKLLKRELRRVYLEELSI
jgi:long-chain acyl-CoA synthetase